MTIASTEGEFAPLRVVSAGELDRLSEKAVDSGRCRVNLNLHSSYSEICQRFFNAIEPNSYLRPHRQLAVPKRKLLVGIRGRFAVFVFSEHGEVERILDLSADCSGNIAIEIPAGRWNTVISLEVGSVLLEVKSGPFDPDAPFEYAPWAPEPGGADANTYLEQLRELVRTPPPRLLGRSED